MKMPNLEKFKKKEEKKNLKLRFVDVNRINYLEKLSERAENYIKQLMQQFKKIEEKDNKIDELNDKIDTILETLKIKEEQRRKSAGKIGGLKASLNIQKKKNEQLVKDIAEMLDDLDEKNAEINDKNIELEFKNKEIEMLRDNGKKKNIESYKNFFEARKELEKREKNEKKETTRN